MVIVFSLVFVALGQFMRSLYQQELDETAKEIYITAQNHLTVAESLGALPNKTNGTADTFTDEGKEDGAGIYYYVVPQNSTSLAARSSMLYAMLPPHSIDGKVRDAGSYIIRYQYNSSSATVLDVFYADPSGRYPYTLETADFSRLFAQGEAYTEMNDAGKEARANYEGAIIGYYGGADVSYGTTPLATPIIEVHNEADLYVRLMNRSAFPANSKFAVSIIGEKSGAIHYEDLEGSTDFFVIDSIAEQGHHFAELGEEFIPGENIIVQVFALSGDELQISKSAKQTTNSLFASLNTTSSNALVEAFDGTSAANPSQSGGGSEPKIVKISNIRHLENLSKTISGYDSIELAEHEPESYEQTVDLYWYGHEQGFCESVANLPYNNTNASAVRIYPLSGNPTGERKFMPVEWTANKLVYEGNARKITGVEVNASANVGLFGTINSGSDNSISNLELVNFRVNTSSGNVGTLAGSIAGNTTLTNIVAHDSTGSTSYGVASQSGNAGGLVGAMTGGSAKGCAAAVYVSASASAGGLIGSANNTSITYSYSGGHTLNGKYENASSGDRYASNVSGSTAGGLVGTLSGGSVANSYSTCSAAGTTAGIFAGATNITPSNCYAVGSVNDVAWGITDLAGNALTTETYNSLVAGGKNAAHAYDTALTSKYGGKFPLKTLAEMTGASDALGLSSATSNTLTAHLNSHYGDWPAIVTLVVND